MIGVSCSCYLRSQLNIAMTAPSAIRLVAALVIAVSALASDSDTQSPTSAAFSEFQFVRLAYTEMSGGFRGGERWLTDFPEAEQHLVQGIRRLTRIATNEEGLQLAIMDPKLYDHPWVYAVEVGRWMLSDEEVVRLRDYLLRGGFLMVDDFHGSVEWEGFAHSMRRVFPDRPIVDIPLTDPVFHLQYDLDNSVQIPGIGAASRGTTYERDGITPHWRGIYDDSGRLVVVINFNMDLGDAWEHADVPEYALMYTARAYKFAINYVLYSMTH
jgi:hypothetical protein